MADETRTATVLTRVERLQNETLVGMTIGQVRQEFGAALNILADSTPHLGNRQLDDEYVLNEGDEIVFSLATGEKG